MRTRQLKEACEANRELDAKAEYEKIYRLLLAKYSDFTMGFLWKDWKDVRTSYKYHSESAPKLSQSKITVNDDKSQDIDAKEIILFNNEYLIFYILFLPQEDLKSELLFIHLILKIENLIIILNKNN